ncbi:MAG: MlaD family protein [Chromatiales bacterium]|nr:MlaD family protein [Chromatiales bacterium]
MQSRISPTLIGGFVLASLVLGLTSVLLFSNGTLANKPTQFILFFEGDVKGLQVGSPVNFRGVKVGQVESMSITYVQASKEFRIPVVIGIRDGHVEVDGVVTESGGKLELDELIAQGLRARLNLQSLVTGKLEIELDFMPETPIRLVADDNRYPEIPTVQSSMEKLATAIEQIPVERITQRLSEILDSIDEMMADGELKRLTTSLLQIAKRLDQISLLLANEAPELLANGNATLVEARAMIAEVAGTAKQTRALISATDENLTSAFSRWDKTLASGDQAFREVGDTVNTTDRLLNEDSELVSQLTMTLRELGSAARAIRIMSEYLERHPEALLRGKQ